MKSRLSNGGTWRRVPLLAAASMALALGACTTLGTGMGSTSPGDAPTAQSTEFAPMWAGWSPGWRDWGYGFNGYGEFPFEGTTTNYTGKVVANLQGPNSQRMRCNFALNNPPSGMGGGGQGKCQLAGGETVDAVFPHG